MPDRLDKLREEFDRAFGKLMDAHLAGLNRVSLAYVHDLLTETQYEVQFKELRRLQAIFSLRRCGFQ